jgi:putative Mg2+ transporter-C (MgtC) family protein
MTASIGILIGIGFWFPALVGAVATLLVLSVFRTIENWVPSEIYAHFHIRFRRESVLDDKSLRLLVGEIGFTIAHLESRLTDEGRLFEYRMVIRTRDRDGSSLLSKRLLSLPDVVEFRISPTGD